MSATPTPPPRPGDTWVQSFARGLAVIRTFSAEAPRQTLTEVAQRAGLTRAGARRILLTLVQLGYVKSDGKLFALTPKILDLGFAYLSSLPLWNRAEPLMEQLVAEVHESCSAAVLDGADVVYVLRVPTQRIMSINLGIGSRLPACTTSMGRVLLAALPPAEADALIAAHPPRAFNTRTLVDQKALREELDRVRERGWCLVDQELEEGLVSIAAPIVDRRGVAIAALNVSGQAQRTPAARMEAEILPRLREAAQRISALISR